MNERISYRRISTPLCAILFLVSGCFGSSTVEPGPDDGGLEDASVDSSIPPFCGDGIVDDAEECDEGESNANAPDACREDCLQPICGDGIVDSGEQCDVGSLPAAERGDEGSPCTTAHECLPSAPICSRAGQCQDGSLGDSCAVDADCGSSAPICNGGLCGIDRCPATPTAEVCDGIDNNCDGTVDEGCDYTCERSDTPIVDRIATCSGDCNALSDALFVPCGAVYEMQGTRTYAGPIVIDGWVRVVAESGVLRLEGQSIAIAGLIDGDARGFARDEGPGSSTNGNGGSHGGPGAPAAGFGVPQEEPGPTYGTDDTRTIDVGSGGASVGDANGGAGGAGVHLIASEVSISGVISCNGGHGTPAANRGGGGGSGGGILIEGAELLSIGGARLSAGGGEGGGPVGPTGTGGGGGGGGRIKIFADGVVESDGLETDVRSGVGYLAHVGGVRLLIDGVYYQNF